MQEVKKWYLVLRLSKMFICIYNSFTILKSGEIDRSFLVKNLLNKESLEKYFRELVGIDENKPFECVGTRSEVVASLKYIIEKGEKAKTY